METSGSPPKNVNVTITYMYALQWPQTFELLSGSAPSSSTSTILGVPPLNSPSLGLIVWAILDLLWAFLRDAGKLLWKRAFGSPTKTVPRFSPESAQEGTIALLDKLSSCCVVDTKSWNTQDKSPLPDDWLPIPTNISIRSALYGDSVYGRILKGNEVFYNAATQFDYHLIVLSRTRQPAKDSPAQSSSTAGVENMQWFRGPIPFSSPYQCAIAYTGKKLLQLFPDGRLDCSVFPGVDLNVLATSPPPAYLSTLRCPDQGGTATTSRSSPREVNLAPEPNPQTPSP
ncbi:uncharacterized protein BXZ73DRAFT_81092 [Epithele typhae]|uniref:uncharacterized protein n=1 Tax=Epithele typhae TaxID=378194 RepID=UPI0020074A4F|nr:uncharacterized protein BXZ73DRAFT_81092 [Epithele typhae]KAH9916408.1 hypothetical protein BXZ73DRAFT_81092 [Epithele typhae]